MTHDGGRLVSISDRYVIPENLPFKNRSFQNIFTSTGLNHSFSVGENLADMKLGLIFTMLLVFGSAARLRFHGSIYHYGNAGYLSPRQAAVLKKILKIKCIKKYGPRFC